jgi:hypothetical protein
MGKLGDRIREFLVNNPGLTDREIANAVVGRQSRQQPINQECRRLETNGHLVRRRREDGLIGNYLSENRAISPQRADEPVKERAVLATRPPVSDDSQLSEDEVKTALKDWLDSRGWTTKVAWARERGIDIEARQGSQRWVIEAKGCGSLQPMRVNYFLMMLGELLQRMDDPETKYSIALPNMKQYRGLWERLPALAKQRTTISMLLVSHDGKVTELK